MIRGLVPTQRNILGKVVVEDKEKESKSELTWEPHITQTPGSSRSSQACSFSSWRRGVTYRSLSHASVSLEEATAYLLPAWDKNHSKAVTTYPDRASFQLGKDASPAWNRFLSLSGSLLCLTRQHFDPLWYLYYTDRKASFLQLTGLACSLWVTWVYQTSKYSSKNP